MRFSARGLAAAQADTDHETVLRLRATMDAYLASHGREAMISVLHVRDLLNPRGLWSLDPGRRQQAEEREQPQDGRSPTADPITGCEPVTAPDS